MSLSKVRVAAKSFTEECFNLQCAKKECKYRHVILKSGKQSIYNKPVVRINNKKGSILNVFRYRRFRQSIAFDCHQFDASSTFKPI